MPLTFRWHFIPPTFGLIVAWNGLLAPGVFYFQRLTGVKGARILLDTNTFL